MAGVDILETFEVAPNPAVKQFIITLANTADAADTVELTLADYGISTTGLLCVEGWKHTTDGSVIVPETVALSSVTEGVLTITVPSTVSNDFCVYRITGKGTGGKFV